MEHVDAAETILVINYDGVPLSRIANYVRDRVRGLIFGMVHADVVFGPGALNVFVREAFAGHVCGVVGMNPDLPYPESYVWSNKNPGPVSTLDSASVFFRRDLDLRFDEETFDSFHLHVEDFCIQAAQRDIPVVVPAADAYHDSCEVNGQPWLVQYGIYRQRLSEKWPGVRFGVT